MRLKLKGLLSFSATGKLIKRISSRSGTVGMLKMQCAAPVSTLFAIRARTRGDEIAEGIPRELISLFSARLS